MSRGDVCTLFLLVVLAASCSRTADIHSPQVAAPIARDLWEAARDADLAEVERLIKHCADPLVPFPDADGRTFTAREIARARLDGIIGPAPGTQDKVALALAEELLREAERRWEERCSDQIVPA